MHSLSPLSVAVLLLLVMICGCTPTATITLTPNTLPPEGADAEKEDGSWEVEAEIVRNDINGIYVTQSEVERFIAYQSIDEVDHPGDGLIHGGFGVMLGSLPVLGGSFLLVQAAGADIDADGAAQVFLFMVPVGMLGVGIGMVVSGFTFRRESREAASKPASVWRLEPFISGADGTSAGLTFGGTF